MKRIGLDLRGNEPGFKAHFGRGTGRYASELWKALEQLAESEGDVEFVPLGRATLGASSQLEALLRLIPAGRMTLETQFLLPRRLDRLQLDLLHFLAHGDAPARLHTPSVVTVLDVIPLRFPEIYRAGKPNWRFRFARSLEQRAIQNACGIIAISEATKRDVVQFLGIAPEKIVVTPLAASVNYGARPGNVDFLQNEAPKIRQRLGLDPQRPMLLYVGGIDPRKNIPFLIESFAELLRADSRDPKPQLVLVGNYREDDQFPRAQQQVRDRGLVQDVHFVGFVAEEKLPLYFQAANIFVFPSLYEGFGIPVLEAMASGVPVVAANNSSIPEVVGNSFGLLPDSDRNAWTGELRRLLASPEEQLARAERGKKRASIFSWEVTARRTLAAYRYFLDQNKRNQGRESSVAEIGRKVADV